MPELLKPKSDKAARGPFSIFASAFTLAELLIVVAIVAILTAVGVPQYQRHIRNQKIQLAKFDLGVISAAADDNYSMYGSFAVPDPGSSSIVGSALVVTHILLGEVSLATSGSPAAYSFSFYPSGSGFYVDAIPDATACSGCPSLRIDRGSPEIIFF